ncbi:hypothetical protein [Morganella morganii]|uniref:hypothetical protein n=1 Tax=Morganella morganii TaxID=582 RepID=UPI0013D75556|nr:hypothetical protein [Morganella morganii]NGF17979.1 hypothetical protein [Morganella morganii]
MGHISTAAKCAVVQNIAGQQSQQINIPKVAMCGLFSYSALIMVMCGTISPLVLVQFQQR